MSSIGEKVDHVRGAKQTRDHECHWPRCGKQVKPAQWGCAHHWYRLPYKIRQAIWQTYRIGQEQDQRPSLAYAEAAQRAQDWIRDHGGEP